MFDNFDSKISLYKEQQPCSISVQTTSRHKHYNIINNFSMEFIDLQILAVITIATQTIAIVAYWQTQQTTITIMIITNSDGIKSINDNGLLSQIALLKQKVAVRTQIESCNNSVDNNSTNNSNINNNNYNNNSNIVNGLMYGLPDDITLSQILSSASLNANSNGEVLSCSNHY